MQKIYVLLLVSVMQFFSVSCASSDGMPSWREKLLCASAADMAARGVCAKSDAGSPLAFAKAEPSNSLLAAGSQEDPHASYDALEEAYLDRVDDFIREAGLQRAFGYIQRLRSLMWGTSFLHTQIDRLHRLRLLPEGRGMSQGHAILKSAYERISTPFPPEEALVEREQAMKLLMDFLDEAEQAVSQADIQALSELISPESCQNEKYRAAVPESIAAAFKILHCGPHDSLKDVSRKHSQLVESIEFDDSLSSKYWKDMKNRRLQNQRDTIFNYYGYPIPKEGLAYNPRDVSYPFAPSLLLLKDAQPARSVELR